MAKRWPRIVSNDSDPQIHAYIVWNEPNLASEWGGNTPSAADYSALLQNGYEGVKAGLPDALVISAGLAPTTDDLPNSVDDRTYLQQMYDAGAGSYFDYLGANPMGFAVGPDADGANGYDFSRAEEWRAIMDGNGDSATQMWATEFGWLRDSANDLGDYNWMKVSEFDQAPLPGTRLP